jgi:hypothetical protein
MGMDWGERKAIIIFGRGYPSKDLIKYLQDEEIKYVMRVPKRFNSRIDNMKKGSKVIKLSEGMKTRAIVFRLKSGEWEALITNMEEEEIEAGAFPEPYYKRRPVETKYNRMKQKFELENFGGRQVDTVERDFYAMMTVSNMFSSSPSEANEEMPKGKNKEKNKVRIPCECEPCGGR